MIEYKINDPIYIKFKHIKNVFFQNVKLCDKGMKENRVLKELIG